VLTYVEGEVAHPNPWSDDGIWRVGQLLRELHDATASFRPPEDAVWQPWYFHSNAPGSIVGHCDTGPWHVVGSRRPSRAGRLVTHMIEFAIPDCAWEAIRAQVTPESTDPTPVWALAWRARAAAHGPNSGGMGEHSFGEMQNDGEAA
jgi:hypothetical protein